jgi:steroid delta-isomerase-like uncharacterized protein
MAETRTDKGPEAPKSESEQKSGNGTAKKPAKPRRSAKSRANEALARKYFDAVAARDPAAMAGFWVDDGVLDLVPVAVVRGPSGVKQIFSEMFAAVPDMDMHVDRVVADDTTAVVQWRLEGTFDGGPFQGVDSTGRRLDLRGVDLLDIEDDKLVRNTAFFDGAAFARGIGMLPAQDSGAERAMKSAFNAATKVRKALAERGIGQT